ncbi:DUF3783 domain-containing protein [Clostridium sp.]|uniref:DUF3783 domain-containing protein n=1 Tax=Clostridium sp. TaxID=1506 RepID=UPI0025BC18C9|nr:DUF3783 domain-containing protein [Clostridium sp.]MBS4955855.1 DUF3783 domain-containing protein [Clostridium sp.]MDO5780414.1 DUF3783 domain-containing protein [Clostridium sp.]MDU4882009.1 DUF3783 domain-containing protein [Clostridium celatum]MDU7075395.1 DUF3783 domain-containing protein [Clostridium celatum]
MSFDKLDIKDSTAREGRACILLCNLAGKDLQKVKNCAMILGIRDQIILNSKNGNTVIKDVLDNNINTECEDGRKERAIIFNAIPPAKMNIFIENLKKVRVNNVLKAVVTETSIDWTVNEVLSNLVAERIAISKGDFTDQHSK